jgi:hypothetical protein
LVGSSHNVGRVVFLAGNVGRVVWDFAGNLGRVVFAGNVGRVVCRTGGSRKRPTFNWQTSGDGGKTIASASSTPHAKATFANLALLSTLSVRVSVTLGSTTSDWSQWVSMLVH